MFRQKSYSLAFHIPILNIKVPLCSQSINLKQNTGAWAREDAPCSLPPMAMRGYARSCPLFWNRNKSRSWSWKTASYFSTLKDVEIRKERLIIIIIVRVIILIEFSPSRHYIETFIQESFVTLKKPSGVNHPNLLVHIVFLEQNSSFTSGTLFKGALFGLSESSL